MNGFVEEMLSGQKTILAYAYEDQVEERFDRINAEVAESYNDAEYYGCGMGPSVNAINNLGLCLVAMFGSLLYMKEVISLGQISSFVLYSRKFSGPINEIANIVNELFSALSAAERVFNLLDQEEEPEDIADAAELRDVRGKVELSHVYFGYDAAKTIIHNLNLTADAGKLIAIVGPTGAGKTTIINLLMRFYDVKEGKICVDGADIRDVTRESLRANYGMVLQETWLKSGTVRENIIMGKPDATEEEIIAAAKASHAHSFIKRLPDGYDTVIGEDGGSLSQGQKQLLCITRVMLCLPPMLILDEATSSIDTRTEIKIQQAFATMMKGRTSFIVAHRLSTIREADIILVMKDGNIIEQGNHETLLKQNGFYAKLYNSQFAL